jgi:hypothetical protein
MRDSAIVIPVSALRRILVILIVLIALTLVALAVRGQVFRAGIGVLFSPSVAEVIDPNAYQSVFLTNGSSYYGRLEAQGSDWFTLRDVFYLSVSDQTGTQLVKRGSEAWGPKDPMIIPRSQVLVIENLRDDSDVVAAIRKYKAGQLPTATPPPATVAPTPSPTAVPSTAKPSPTPTR